MMVSTKGRYALRVLIDLAEHQTDGYIPLKDTAARQEISEKYNEYQSDNCDCYNRFVPFFLKQYAIRKHCGYKRYREKRVPSSPKHKCDKQYADYRIPPYRIIIFVFYKIQIVQQSGRLFRQQPAGAGADTGNLRHGAGALRGKSFQCGNGVAGDHTGL